MCIDRGSATATDHGFNSFCYGNIFKRCVYHSGFSGSDSSSPVFFRALYSNRCIRGSKRSSGNTQGRITGSGRDNEAGLVLHIGFLGFDFSSSLLTERGRSSIYCHRASAFSKSALL